MVVPYARGADDWGRQEVQYAGQTSGSTMLIMIAAVRRVSPRHSARTLFEQVKNGNISKKPPIFYMKDEKEFERK